MKSIDIIDQNGMGISLDSNVLFFIATIPAVFIIALYVLRSIGLFVLAKRQKVKGYGLAWVPLLWIYVVAKLIGEIRFFKNTYAKNAILITVIYAVIEILPIISGVLTFLPLVGYYLQGGEIVITEAGSSVEGFKEYFMLSNVHVRNIVYPYRNLVGVSFFVGTINMLTNILGLVETVLLIFMYIALFKKFWPEHYVIGSIMSYLGLFGVFVFVIRNKKPINYAEYLRSHGFYTGYRYGGGANPYENVYRQTDSGKATESDNADPFSGYAKKKENEDPFSDFFNDGKK